MKRLAAAEEFAPGCRRIELGSPAMSTIAIHVTRLDKGASFSEEPSTLSRIFATMQGEADAVVGDKSFATKRGDVVAAPSVIPAKWTARSECYLLRVSDEPLLKYLNWLRPIAGRA